MSRTYRRKNQHVHIQKLSEFYYGEIPGIRVSAGYGYDKQNSLYIHLNSQEDAESPWVKRSIARHFSDSGTTKRFRNWKFILKNRYRAQCKQRLHDQLLNEEVDVLFNTFTKFSPGIWWD